MSPIIYGQHYGYVSNIGDPTFQLINPYRIIAVDELLATIVDKLHEASDLLSRIKRECGTCYLVPWDIDPIIAHINILIMEYEYQLTFLNY